MMKDKVLFDNINNMINNPLCTGCGGCVGICPTNALSLRINDKGIYRVKFEEGKCVECGLCVGTCPVSDVLIDKHINNTALRYDEDRSYLKAYMAYSKDPEIRWDSSSGGAITEILVYLLRNNVVNGVVIPSFSGEPPYIFGPKIITDIREIYHHKGSKYVPIPMAKSIKDIIKFKGSVAFVGLPCHIWSVRNVMERIPSLQKKIKVVIGPVCGQTPNFYATKYLLYKLGLSERDIKKVEYRGSGWPGYFKIYTKKNDKIIRIPYESSLGMGTVFSSIVYTPFYCNFCLDPLNTYADISVGDAWFLKFQNKLDIADGGISIIMTHSEIGENIIQSLLYSGNIEIEEIPEKYVYLSYKDLLRKREKAKNLLNCVHLSDRKDHIKCKMKHKIRSLLNYALIKYFTALDMDKFNRYVPLWILVALKVLKKI